MLCKCYWIVLYIVHFTAFCLGGGAFFPGHGVHNHREEITFFCTKTQLVYTRR